MRLWPRINTVLLLLVLLAVVGLFATRAFGGPLDPPGPVGSTMRTIDQLLPSWGQTLSSMGGCASERFACVMSNQAVLDEETGLARIGVEHAVAHETVAHAHHHADRYDQWIGKVAHGRIIPSPGGTTGPCLLASCPAHRQQPHTRRRPANRSAARGPPGCGKLYGRLAAFLRYTYWRRSCLSIALVARRRPSRRACKTLGNPSTSAPSI